MKIIADDKIPFLKGILEPYAELIYLPGKEISRDVIKDADALLIRTRTKCTESLLAGTNVKFIGTATIGFDHIDTQYCERHGIAWSNSPGCNSSSVQQYIASALMKLAYEFGIKLEDKTIGIVGVGNVGTKVAKLASLLGMSTMLCDPPREKAEGSKDFVSLENILYESDLITVHVPLNIVGENSTYHLFNMASFEKMKKGTWFINSSRGEVTKSAALKQALDSNKLAGAIIDVWENEPDIDVELMSQVFIATPHIAGYSTDGKANGTSMIVNSLAAFFDLPLNKWYPSNVPLPEKTEIIINGTGKSDLEVIREAVTFTYDITDDDTKFRFSPSDFEKHREEYLLRREFPSYSIKLINCSSYCNECLKDMGFKISV